ncbi:hypothetical protein GGI35DRAFT_140917 [Trichoderma velutinum]
MHRGLGKNKFRCRSISGASQITNDKTVDADKTSRQFSTFTFINYLRRVLHTFIFTIVKPTPEKHLIRPIYPAFPPEYPNPLAARLKAGRPRQVVSEPVPVLKIALQS